MSTVSQLIKALRQRRSVESLNIHIRYVYAPLVLLETTFSTLMPLMHHTVYLHYCLSSDSKTEPK